MPTEPKPVKAIRYEYSIDERIARGRTDAARPGRTQQPGGLGGEVGGGGLARLPCAVGHWPAGWTVFRPTDAGGQVEGLPTPGADNGARCRWRDGRCSLGDVLPAAIGAAFGRALREPR